MDDETKQDIALFRVAVLGALIGAELEHGDLVALCREAAERRWEWPDGTLEHLAARTIEGWYYAYRHGGFAALMPKDRADLAFGLELGVDWVALSFVRTMVFWRSACNSTRSDPAASATVRTSRSVPGAALVIRSVATSGPVDTCSMVGRPARSAFDGSRPGT